jgi:hypothetical protein
MATDTYHQEHIEAKYIDRMLQIQLKASLKQHLLKAIDSELEQICDEAIKEHITVSRRMEQSAATYSTNYFYTFVQNIIRTEMQEVVVTKVKQ